MARKFAPILKMAAGHHGGEAAALEKSQNAHAVKNLAKVPADRLLSVMTRCVFNAGFNWKVTEADKLNVIGRVIWIGRALG